MPVKHDLYQDLSCTKEVVQQKRANDPHLNALLDKYSVVDNQVLSAEAQALGDDDVRKLKEKRLSIKDEISKSLNGSVSR
ncbi:hypothetical protein SAMN04487857_13411 [Pseudomonas sp. ok272]|uniref:DUF465 domain-containing protein n=1 Tax=unclassified Pseudomonas TaxID=196821 RepID=UPI0008C99AAD|nr:MULTISPECIES: DUF465 domain-containing protein [unclassified Pseudomonas]SEN66894.1 hypothetical protein SAMN04487857_13411 [Pseudomonas sp. ok272]SFM86873.1 hypothetical protein SAMN04487858_10811 [Pseudomonas sp. ok602]